MRQGSRGSSSSTAGQQRSAGGLSPKPRVPSSASAPRATGPGPTQCLLSHHPATRLTSSSRSISPSLLSLEPSSPLAASSAACCSRSAATCRCRAGGESRQHGGEPSGNSR